MYRNKTMYRVDINQCQEIKLDYLRPTSANKEIFLHVSLIMIEFD